MHTIGVVVLPSLYFVRKLNLMKELDLEKERKRVSRSGFLVGLSSSG
jgi:hypothetical protein